MRIYIVEPGKKGYVKDLDMTDSYEVSREIVGGYLEYADLFVYGYKGLENVTLVLNDEGLLRQLPFNRGLVPQEDNIMGQPVGEVLNGTFGRAFFVGLTRANAYRSLTDDEVEALKKYFEKPQKLVRFDNKLLAISI